MALHPRFRHGLVLKNEHGAEENKKPLPQAEIVETRFISSRKPGGVNGMLENVLRL